MVTFVLCLLLLELLFHVSELVLLRFQKTRHRNQQAEYKQQHDFSHGEAENQALLVRRPLLNDLTVHGWTRFLTAIDRGCLTPRVRRKRAPRRQREFPASER